LQQFETAAAKRHIARRDTVRAHLHPPRPLATLHPRNAFPFENLEPNKTPGDEGVRGYINGDLDFEW